MPGGRPHAEAVAVASAGIRARGSTAYVTLEPCAHVGRSGSCADRLVEAGVSRVVTALKDPDQRVAGRGHQRLRSAGIEVFAGCSSESAVRDHRGFLLKTVVGRPMVTLKLAMSLDGRVACRTGHSKWVTGRPARRLVHVMRSQHDAVLVGRGTAQADDPSLTCRLSGDVGAPARIVLDTRLGISTGCKLAASIDDAPLWICHGTDCNPQAVREWSSLGARLVLCRHGPEGGLDLDDVLKKLAMLGITRILCEGGPRVATSLIAKDLVDDLVGFTAGLVLGGDAMPSVGDLHCLQVGDGHRFNLLRVDYVGDDTISVWTRPLDFHHLLP